MKKSKKKGFKLPKYKDGAEFGKNVGNTGLFVLDTMLAEWAPNAIKQDQYSNTKYGKTLGDVASVHESFDSQSPISKNVSKHWNDGKTGMTEDQQKLYGQAQPFAKTGSKIGEMWTGAALGGANMGAGASGTSGGAASTGQGQMMGQMFSQGSQQFLNTQYDPMTNMQNSNDPNITGSNGYGRNQNNPYYKEGGAFNLIHPFNNPNFNIPMFPMGGNTQFGGNAQLEKQENTLNPDGTTTQFNLPTHENQSPEEGTKLDPGTLIFSDRLKPKGVKKTFAILNKPNNTDKEDKVLDNTSSTGLAKRTAQLMKDVKHKNSLKLFQEQEILKQSKANNYIKRLGGVMQFPEGGYLPDTNYAGKDAMGFPVDKTGRRLTAEEQIGFNRPFNSYGNNVVAGSFNTGAGLNQNTGKANLGLQNSLLNTTNMGKTMNQPFSYTAGQTTPDGRPISYNDAFNNYLATQTDAYGKPLKQKLGGMMPKYKDGARLQEMTSPEPELMPYDYNKSYNSPWDNPEWIAANANQNSSSTDQSTGPNFKGMLGQAGMWAANNAGELAYLIDQGKKYDTQQEYKYNPTLLDPTASLRDADIMTKTAAYDLADKASGHAGNYLTNRTALATSMLL